MFGERSLESSKTEDSASGETSQEEFHYAKGSRGYHLQVSMLCVNDYTTSNSPQTPSVSQTLHISSGFSSLLDREMPFQHAYPSSTRLHLLFFLIQVDENEVVRVVFQSRVELCPYNCTHLHASGFQTTVRSTT